jgi:hypothetical protein
MFQHHLTYIQGALHQKLKLTETELLQSNLYYITIFTQPLVCNLLYFSKPHEDGISDGETCTSNIRIYCLFQMWIHWCDE